MIPMLAAVLLATSAFSVRTDTTGGSMLGYSRTAMRVKDKNPTSTIIKLITVASTGRLMEISERTIA